MQATLGDNCSMPLPSLALLLAAAGMHAAANALLKQARDKLSFTWWMLGATTLPGIPLLFFLGRVDPAGWPYVLLSGATEAVYFSSLGRAYSRGDLSQVYPIARGSAPLFVVMWAALFLGERPASLGLLGILSIVAGLYLINLPSLADWKKPLLGFRTSASRWALLTGLLISIYSALDKKGSSYFDPVVYLYLVLAIAWIALTPQWLIAGRRVALLDELRPGASTRSSRAVAIVAAAVLGLIAYLLVLLALRISPVSYVSPVREISVVIGAWIGVKLMGESGGMLRLSASILVVVGILLIALGG